MIRAALIWLALALPAIAQELPEPLSRHVSDFAGVLEDDDRVAITDQLDRIRRMTNVEGLVVTIPDLVEYGTDDLGSFTIFLLEDWLVEREIMSEFFAILYAEKQEEYFIQLGDVFPESALQPLNDILAELKRQHQKGDVSGGLRMAVDRVNDQIVLPAMRPTDVGVSTRVTGPKGLHILEIPLPFPPFMLMIPLPTAN